MNITVNGEPRSIEAQVSIEQLLCDLRGSEDGKKGIAVAVNDEVVPRERWETQRLKNSDNVLIITATQGG